MTDYENKDLNEAVQGTPQGAPVQPAAPEAAPVVPQLTVDPDPVVPEIPEVEAPAPQAAVPQYTAPQQQYTAPNYTAPQQQYTAPNYTAPQNGAPYQPQPGYYQQPMQPQQAAKPRYDVPPAGYVQKSRIAAGLLAIMLGTFGVHNFYLGNNVKGTIQLVVSLVTCGFGAFAMSIWAIIEGINLLTANNPNYNYDANGVILRD